MGWKRWSKRGGCDLIHLTVSFSHSSFVRWELLQMNSNTGHWPSLYGDILSIIWIQQVGTLLHSIIKLPSGNILKKLRWFTILKLLAPFGFREAIPEWIFGETFSCIYLFIYFFTFSIVVLHAYMHSYVLSWLINNNAFIFQSGLVGYQLCCVWEPDGVVL